MNFMNIKKTEASKISVATDMGKLRNGLKTFFIKYDGQPFVFQTPWMKMPFDPDEHENDRRSYTLCCDDDSFKSGLKFFDGEVKRVAKEERPLQFFKKSEVSEEFFEMNYTPAVRNGGEYSDKFKIKSDRGTTFYDRDGTKSEMTPTIKRGSELRAIVECKYVWLNAGKLGATFVAKQIQHRSNDLGDELLIVDLVDEDED